MKDDRQFELFGGGPVVPVSTCDVVVFPLYRRRRTVESAARGLLARKTDQWQRHFWLRTIRPLQSELAARGLSPDEIERELLRFKVAVRVAMDVLTAAAGPRGGAA